MNKHELRGETVAAQLDRLAAGDLPEPERRALLAWLDEVPARWRACGLAFLEAQVWEQAIGGGQREGEALAPDIRAEPRVQGSGFRVQEKRDIAARPWATWLAIAASLLVAFVAGVLAGRGAESAPARENKIIAAIGPTIPPGLQLATVSVKTNLDPRLKAQLTLPVEPADQPPAPAPAVSDYDRKLWERRGYELVEEVRYLPAKMPDGRTVMVPVNHVHLRLKRTPVS
jgi:hypothetical protein